MFAIHLVGCVKTVLQLFTANARLGRKRLSKQLDTENDGKTCGPLAYSGRKGIQGYAGAACPRSSELSCSLPTELLHIAYTKSDAIMIPFAIAIPCVYTYLGKPWYITNILSFAFAYSAIKAMKLDGFLTGATLLAGLFLYDIFWVFGTPVVSGVVKGSKFPQLIDIRI